MFLLYYQMTMRKKTEILDLEQPYNFCGKYTTLKNQLAKSKTKNKNS